MEDQKKLLRMHRMLQTLTNLPRKILAHQDIDNITEFVVYDLCHEQCFNLDKAAYFIDNPDFDCFKGVVGFSRKEICSSGKCAWEEPEDFTSRMKSSSFNQKVKEQLLCSVRKSETPDEQLIKQIASNLAIDEFNYCSWKMKHDNLGLFIYQQVEDDIQHECLLDGLSLLSFCPVC